MPISANETRKCAICGTEFIPYQDKNRFCSDKCRVQNSRLKKKAEIEQTSSELVELKAKPSQMVETTKIVSPEWRKLQNQLSVHQQRETKLVAEKEKKLKEIHAITEGNKMGILGVVLGASAAGYFAGSKLFKNQHKNAAISTASVVVAILAMIGAGTLGLILGSAFGKKINRTDQATLKKLEKMNNALELLETKILEEQIHVIDIEEEMEKVKQYESETIKITRTVGITDVQILEPLKIKENSNN